MSAAVRIPLYLVDAFAAGPFTGNPAAVCLLSAWPADAWLQNLAAELKQSETAFLVPRDELFELRWFTPAVEVDLCGHATLASALVLWHAGLAQPSEPIRFSTRSGILVARERAASIELDFPLEPLEPCDAPPGLLAALGARPTYVGRSRFDLFVEVAAEAELRALAPDFRSLAAVDCRGVIVTARSARGEFDFVSRFFAPASGIDEDPVTGSAHCALAFHWHRRLGKSEFTAYQASPRGGVVGVRIAGDRVLLGGRAVLVFEGQLQTAPLGGA
jgi:predicted PhzF superfamily epimerase YddE/YHI9